MQFGPNDLLATARENEVVVWNSATGHRLAEVTADASVTALAFTADELTRLRSGEHKVMLILLAILLGEPERAHGLLRTLASDATLPTNFTTLVRRSAGVDHTPRPTVARRRLTPASDQFETTLARVIAETEAVDDTNSYQRWATVVSRYFFRFVDP